MKLTDPKIYFPCPTCNQTIDLSQYLGHASNLFLSLTSQKMRMIEMEKHFSQLVEKKKNLDTLTQLEQIRYQLTQINRELTILTPFRKQFILGINNGK